MRKEEIETDRERTKRMVSIFETGLWQKQISRRYLCTHLMIDFIYHMMCNFVLCREQTCLSLSRFAISVSLSLSFISLSVHLSHFVLFWIRFSFSPLSAPLHLSEEESPVSLFFFSYIFFHTALSFLRFRSRNLSLVCCMCPNFDNVQVVVRCWTDNNSQTNEMKRIPRIHGENSWRFCSCADDRNESIFDFITTLPLLCAENAQKCSLFCNYDWFLGALANW